MEYELQIQQLSNHQSQVNQHHFLDKLQNQYELQLQEYAQIIEQLQTKLEQQSNENSKQNLNSSQLK